MPLEIDATAAYWQDHTVRTLYAGQYVRISTGVLSGHSCQKKLYQIHVPLCYISSEADLRVLLPDLMYKAPKACRTGKNASWYHYPPATVINVMQNCLFGALTSQSTGKNGV